MCSGTGFPKTTLLKLTFASQRCCSSDPFVARYGLGKGDAPGRILHFRVAGAKQFHYWTAVYPKSRLGEIIVWTLGCFRHAAFDLIFGLAALTIGVRM